MVKNKGKTSFTAYYFLLGVLAVSVATPICYAGTDTVVITGQTAPDGNGSISDFMPALGFNNNADIFILGKITDASGANVDDAILLRPGGVISAKSSARVIKSRQAMVYLQASACLISTKADKSFSRPKWMALTVGT